MSNTPLDACPAAAPEAAAELARLKVLVAKMQNRLAELQRDVAEAEGRLENTHASLLVEANQGTVHVDPLTGLPDRAVLLDRLAHGIPHAKRRGVQLALLFLNLNDFTQVNDTLGLAAGDQVLKQVADRLRTCVRQSDTVTRLGGAEFVCLLTEVAMASDAIVVADKLSATLAAPSEVAGRVIRLTASIGISLYPDDGDDATTLLERADLARYRARRSGLGSAFYSGAIRRPQSAANPPGSASLRLVPDPNTPIRGPR